MAHKPRPTDGSPAGRTARWVEACGKFAYGSMREAKKVAKKARRTKLEHGVAPLSAYPCDACTLFHVGHLPGVVKRGEVSRAEYYGRGVHELRADELTPSEA